MDASKLCPAPHIEASELAGKDVEVTIKEVGFGLVGVEQVEKGIVYFDEFDRGFVVNRTNLKRLIRLHGNDTSKWVGQKVTLYPSETDFNGSTVPCIRVREK